MVCSDNTCCLMIVAFFYGLIVSVFYSPSAGSGLVIMRIGIRQVRSWGDGLGFGAILGHAGV